MEGGIVTPREDRSEPDSTALRTSAIRSQHAPDHDAPDHATTMTMIRGFEFPDGLLYLLEHDTWVRRDADGLATIGITSLGTRISGEFLEFMPKPVGTMVERERALGVLEMSKVIRSVRAPISGAIVAINEQARGDPASINTDPYGDGWLVRLQPSSWESDAALLVSGERIPAAVEAYMAFLSETFGEAPP
jgi:glycine cleavage system H protein